MDEVGRPGTDLGSYPPLSWLKNQLSRCPVATIPIAVVRPAESPRLAGESSAHVRLIAESGMEPPPIIVHKPTMRVIDGMHRLKAAMLCGRTHIEAQLYEGNADDAFVVAVQANVVHGLPLPLSDRIHAATRILHSHPTWSDRAIASAAGLSPKTVATIRLRATAGTDTGTEPTSRIGRDGRIRPVSTADRRLLAGELMTRDPDASLRQIAKAVGLAPSTVMDVRARLRAGQDLVPGNQNTDPKPKSSGPRRRAPAEDDPDAAHPVMDRASAIRILMQDPSLRFSEAGRCLLRWLEAQPNAFPDWCRVVDNVPDHCLAIVAELARDSAKAWHTIVDRLERRTQTRARLPACDVTWDGRGSSAAP